MQDSRNLFLKRTNIVQFDWDETVWGENPTFILRRGCLSYRPACAFLIPCFLHGKCLKLQPCPRERMKWRSIGMQDSRNLFLKRKSIAQFYWYETVWGENPTFYCKQKIGKYAYFLFWWRGCYPIVRPAHFFFLTVRSGNAWRSNPSILKYWRRRRDSNPRAA